MMNNITKVNPSNRVDFSRIRAHASGGSILKYQNGKGIIYADGAGTWADLVFAQFKDDLLAAITKAKTDGSIDAYILGINSTQDSYYTLHSIYNDPSKFNEVTYNKNVADYLKKINNDYAFVNIKGINYGRTHNRYQILSKNATSGDKGTDWTNDGFWAAQTNDRTVLGREGDFDPNSESFKAYLAKLNEQGVEMYLDPTNKMWKLRKLNPAPTNTDPKKPDPTSTATTGTSTTQTDPKKYTPTQYQEPFKYKWDTYTGTIPKAAVLGNNLLGATRNYNLEMLKKVPLEEALHHEFIAGNNKALTDSYYNSAANIQAQANNIASQTSNLELNQLMQLQGALLAEQYRMQGELAKTQGYEADRQQALNTANFNNDQSVATANENRVNLVADYNKKLNAKQALNATKTTEISDFINKEATDYGNFRQLQKLNEDVARTEYNQMMANNDMNRIKLAYTDYISNPMESDAFKTSFATALNNYKKNIAESDLTGIDLEYRNFFSQYEDPKSGTIKMDPKELQQKYYQYLQSHSDSKAGNQFYSAFKLGQNDLYNKMIPLQQQVALELQRTNLTFPETYNSAAFYRQGSPKGGTYQSIFSKNGGVLKAANGTSMEISRRLEHRRKVNVDRERMRLQALKQFSDVEARSQKNALIAAKALQESLKRELNSLDNETLLLLRRVFK